MKLVKRCRGFGIYERNNKERTSGQMDASYPFAVFLPEQSPTLLDEPEYNADSLKEAIEFVHAY